MSYYYRISFINNNGNTMNIEAIEQAGEQIWHTRNQMNYTTLGLTVGYTVQMLREGKIYLPEYQPHLVWSNQMMNYEWLMVKAMKCANFSLNEVINVGRVSLLSSAK
jgi:glycine betaine/choline ABC-type transport system substrate-binding protein